MIAMVVLVVVVEEEEEEEEMERSSFLDKDNNHFSLFAPFPHDTTSKTYLDFDFLLLFRSFHRCCCSSTFSSSHRFSFLLTTSPST
ncbi:hypothetical protein E2C01_069062 [Portunus trituberculatus]|uniref:Uncharacterized protein n=1 Tax=Portunus trituberculatus TaxID=210409 RepID=A0A5B7HQG8_PORTR|nr:hypothetical protein [Portunus trituberculatus]